MQRSPDRIENEIYHTQDRLSATLDELADRLNPVSLAKSAFSGGSSAGGASQMGSHLLDRAKDNPLALGLIGAGLAWLLAPVDAKPSALPGIGNDNDEDDGNDTMNRTYPAPSYGTFDSYHDTPMGGYSRHMSAVERRDGELDEDYRRRRDDARAAFLMLERRHDEDEKSYRQRLDEATDSLRERSHSLADTARERAASARDRVSEGASRFSSGVGSAGRSAADGAQDFFQGNPLAAGFLAMAFGAAAGAAIPMSDREHEALGEYGDEARDAISEKAHEAADTAKAKAGKEADKAMAKVEKETDKAKQGLEPGNA